MTLPVAPASPQSTRSRPPRHAHSRRRAGDSADRGARVDRATLGRYADPAGRPREVIARPGCAGSVLVVDRDASTLGDRRLVAHLAADEPPANAVLVCRHYLDDPHRRRCRRVVAEDLRTAPFGADAQTSRAPDAGSPSPPGTPAAELPGRQAGQVVELIAPDGSRYRLEPLASDLSVPELRWRRHPPRPEHLEPEPLSLREVVASLESYRPARDLTAAALASHRDDPRVSVAVLRAELRRLDRSRIVLNRGLRRAVLGAVESQGLSMSEIASRCGRVKYDSHGNASGEVTWLARRVGISPAGGARVPTPWIHSDVLGLIARSGLGISPREVELG